MMQFLAGPVMAVHETAIIEIMHVEPTPLFPRTGEGEPLKQIARLTLNNSGSATVLGARIIMEGE
ncbi:MAG: hypothetical protein KAT15_03065, partial [Bacteroidales bacterium]|nr:hypothetical protein [Bacteroidales bacterium]